MKNILLLIIFLSYCFSASAMENPADSSQTGTSESQHPKLKPFCFLTNLPKDYAAFYKREFKKSQIKKYTVIAVSTGLLIIADQVILDHVQQFGNNIHLYGTDHLRPLFEFTIKTKEKDISLPIEFPVDLNSGLYFIGDGITHFSISFGFWAYGKIGKDYRAQRTGEEILESILASGIATQFLKHITGRESPFTRLAPRGVWRFFPNQKDYANHVPHYDAFPTGHLATAFGTVTVIAENYPEWKMVKPIGYTLCGILGFAMINNGVHWASDYPLGIALGYSFAKVVTARNKDEGKTDTSESIRKKSSFGKPLILPAAFPNGGAGLTSLWSF